MYKNKKVDTLNDVKYFGHRTSGPVPLSLRRSTDIYVAFRVELKRPALSLISDKDSSRPKNSVSSAEAIRCTRGAHQQRLEYITYTTRRQAARYGIIRGRAFEKLRKKGRATVHTRGGSFSRDARIAARAASVDEYCTRTGLVILHGSRQSFSGAHCAYSAISRWNPTHPFGTGSPA